MAAPSSPLVDTAVKAAVSVAVAAALSGGVYLSRLEPRIESMASDVEVNQAVIAASLQDRQRQHQELLLRVQALELR